MSKRLLIIEDELLSLESVEFILTGEGYEVYCFQEGGNIFEKIENIKPHLILLDIMLGEEDGREICRSVKMNDQTKHIPVIMFSAHPDVYRTISDDGANDVVSKPFQLDQFLQRIARQLKQESTLDTFQNLKGN
jgi:DNA-binding response OmpR family regulator